MLETINILWNVALIGFMAYAAYSWYIYRKEKDRKLSAFTLQSNKDAINRALKNLNCKVKWESSEDSFVAKYDYQNGHFRIDLQPHTPFSRLGYMFFFDTELENVELVRSIVNESNVHTEVSRIIYSIDTEEGKINLHAFTPLLISEDLGEELLERSMAEMFRWQQVVIFKFNELVNSSRSVLNYDVEKDNASDMRELFLMRELEMTHQDEGPEWHADNGQPFSLQHFLDVAMGMTAIVPKLLRLSGDNLNEVLEDPDAILHYDISSPLLANGQFLRNSAMGMLDYYDLHNPVELRRLTLGYASAGQTEQTLYYRITMAKVPVSLGREMGLDDLEMGKTACSVLLGYDLLPTESNLAKFRYMLKEAMAKLHQGNENDLTDEEKLLIKLQNPSLTEMLAKGRALFEQKRFYESVRVLENVFRLVQRLENYDVISWHYPYIELCHLIGTCYAHLGQYKKALYFIEITLPGERPEYLRNHVNCLVNDGDPRAINFINTYFDLIRYPMKGDPLNSNQKSTEEVRNFHAFLMRRKSYVLIEKKKYEEAELLLKQLLKDPSNYEFASKELAFIQKKKSQGQ